MLTPIWHPSSSNQRPPFSILNESILESCISSLEPAGSSHAALVTNAKGRKTLCKKRDQMNNKFDNQLSLRIQPILYCEDSQTLEDRTDSVRARYRMEVFSFRVGCLPGRIQRSVFQRGVKVAVTVVQQTLDSGKSKRMLFGSSLCIQVLMWNSKSPRCPTPQFTILNQMIQIRPDSRKWS